METALNEKQIAELKAEAKAFLLERNFDEVDSRDITGVNRDYEFHIYLGPKGISITVIDRFDPTNMGDEFIAYNDQAVVRLYEMIGR